MTPEQKVGLEKLNKGVYLGDAVYASFDGYHVWLRTGDGNNQRIALDPEVMMRTREFISWVEDLRAEVLKEREND